MRCNQTNCYNSTTKTHRTFFKNIHPYVLVASVTLIDLVALNPFPQFKTTKPIALVNNPQSNMLQVRMDTQKNSGHHHIHAALSTLVFTQPHFPRHEIWLPVEFQLSYNVT
jgi:hypothetical protein